MKFVNVFYVLCPEQRIYILFIRLVFLSPAFQNVSSAKLVDGSDKQVELLAFSQAELGAFF